MSVEFLELNLARICKLCAKIRENLT